MRGARPPKPTRAARHVSENENQPKSRSVHSHQNIFWETTARPVFTTGSAVFDIAATTMSVKTPSAVLDALEKLDEKDRGKNSFRSLCGVGTFRIFFCDHGGALGSALL